MPRFAIVNELRKKGLLTKPVPVASVISLSDEAFERRFKAAMEETTCIAGSACAERVREKKSKGAQWSAGSKAVEEMNAMVSK